MSKLTKQSRKTARRKARQNAVWKNFLKNGGKVTFMGKPHKLLFSQLPEKIKSKMMTMLKG